MSSQYPSLQYGQVQEPVPARQQYAPYVTSTQDGPHHQVSPLAAPPAGFEVQTYVAQPPPVWASPEFKHELCSCTDNCDICCYSLWCPCVIIGKNAQMRQGKHPDFGYCNKHAVFNCVLHLIPRVGPLLAACHQSWERCQNRESMNVEQKYCKDFWTTLCCGPCALTQEHMDLRDRYFASLAEQSSQGMPPQGQAMHMG